MTDTLSKKSKPNTLPKDHPTNLPDPSAPPEPTGQIWTPQQQWTLWILLSILLCFLILLYFKAPVRWWGGDTITVQPGSANGPWSGLDPNHADALELASLPRVGEKLAADIVAYRQLHAAENDGWVYKTPEDLERVPGLTKKILDEIRPFLKFPSPTTTAPKTPPGMVPPRVLTTPDP